MELILLADCLAQTVHLLEVEAGQLGPDLHRLLLVNQNLLGRPEDVIQGGVERVSRLFLVDATAVVFGQTDAVLVLGGQTGRQESSLRCRQMVAAENEGQCFRLNVLYDWGASVSMISEEAVEVMGLVSTRQAKRIIKGLGGATTVSKGTCTLGLVARNGDRKTVTAWEVGEIASLPGGEPPEDVDEQFPGLRYLSEPNCLIQKAGPVHLLIGMDHAHLMPEHVAESADLGSQLRLMSSMFGGQHILVGEGAPRLSWVDAMDADERYEAAANRRRKREGKTKKKLRPSKRQDHPNGAQMDTRARKTNAARGSKSLRAVKVHTRKFKATNV